MKAAGKRIVISHASKDKALADKLSDLLTSGCAVNPNDILCTSLEGKGIPAGTASFIEYLKGQFQNPELVILLLSENFFESHFCLCELGAVWAMDLPNFPIVVPPVDKAHLKATLAVAQAGDINNASYLDELRDRVKATVGTDVPTATWTVKRDTLLLGLDAVLKALEKPSSVPVAELKEVEAKYQAALTEIGTREKDVEKLKAQIVDLEKCKDAAEGKVVARKYSSADKQFENLCDAAKAALENLKRATCATLYWEFRDNSYVPDGEDDWNDVRDACAVEELQTPEGMGPGITAREEHPRVFKAKMALRQLAEFLEDPKDHKFFERFEEEHEFPASMRNRDFWRAFLVHV